MFFFVLRMYEQSAEEKLDAAFTACENLGVPRLLEVEDLTEVERPDDKAVMTYVSELFKLFSKEDIKENAANHISKFLVTPTSCFLTMVRLSVLSTFFDLRVSNDV